MVTLERARLDEHHRLAQATALQDAGDISRRVFRSPAAGATSVDLGELRQAWHEHAAMLSRNSAEPLRGRIELCLTLPAGEQQALLLERVHEQLGFFATGVLGTALDRAHLSGAGLGLMSAAQRSELVHHLALVLAWRWDAAWTIDFGDEAPSDAAAEHFAALGFRRVPGEQAQSASRAGGGAPWSTLAVGPGASGVIWGKWRYRLSEPDGEAAAESAVASRRAVVSPHEPARDCRHFVAAELARGEVDLSRLLDRFGAEAVAQLEPDLRALESLELLERTATRWSLRVVDEEQRVAALLFFARPVDLAEAWREAGLSSRATFTAPPETQRCLIIAARDHRIPVVVRYDWPWQRNAGAAGGFAFFYPSDEREVSTPAGVRQAMLEAFSGLVREVVKRYAPADLDELSRLLVSVSQRLAARSAPKVRTFPLVVRAPSVDDRHPARDVDAEHDAPVYVDEALIERYRSRAEGAEQEPLNRGLLRKPPYHIDPSLIIAASNRCNLRCRFCLETGKRMTDMPELDDILAALRRIDPEAFYNVMLMSSETLLRRDVEALIRGIHDLGFHRIGLATNGTTFRDRAQLERLIDAGLSGIELSIHTLDPEHSAWLSGRSFTPRRHRQTLEMLDAVCAERAFGCFINIVVCGPNAGDVVPLIDGIEAEFPAIRPRYHLKYPRYLDKFEPELTPATFEQLRAAGIPDGLDPELLSRVQCVDFPLCAIAPHFELSSTLAAFATGSLCLDLMADGSMRAAFNKTMYSDASTFAPACQDCSLRVLCCGVEPHYLELAGIAHGLRPLTEPPDVALRAATAAARRGLPEGTQLEAAGLGRVAAFLEYSWQMRACSETDR